MQIFSDLDDKEIEQIENSSEYILVAADTILLSENSVSKNVYVVVNGSLESSISVDNGERAQADLFSTGDSFGWAAIVTDQKAIMTVRATSDSLVLVIDGECLQPILLAHATLRDQFSKLVTERIDRLKHIRSKSLEERSALSAAEIRRRIERFITGSPDR